MKVGFYQFRPQFGKIKQNLDHVIGALRNVEADLLVLPELPFTGYYFKDREESLSLAEDPQDSTTVDALKSLCRKQGFHLVTGFCEKSRDRVFNSSLLIRPEGSVEIYRKLHLFNNEKKWFDPGDTPLQVTDVRGAKIGMMVCFDWIFPEVARTLAVQGAHIICHPSNLVLQYCQQTMLARCLENSVFAITANRIGADKRPHGEIKFTGKSQIVAPKAVLLHRTHSQRKALYVTEIDPQLAENKMMTSNQLIQDRRPEYYGTLCQK